ncbi:MAG: hypothetical protein NZ553_07260 [Caldilinea sp.]|nr:hypothetical protein [Caldilinea sp.]MDW8440253.1 hypothetical protein [Caldilineaceae bacterium]
MILTTFRKRFLSIALPQMAGIGFALVTISTDSPLPTMMMAYVSLISFSTILFFWTAFFLSFPNILIGQRKMLFMLYRIGQATFVVTMAVALWSLFSLFGNLSHWLLVGLGLLECSEHFVVRWLDGNGKFFIQRPSHAWIGGAAGIALKRSSKLYNEV